MYESGSVFLYAHKLLCCCSEGELEPEPESQPETVSETTVGDQMCCYRLVDRIRISLWVCQFVLWQTRFVLIPSASPCLCLFQVRVRLTTTQAGSSSKAVDRLEKQLSFQKSVDVRSASPRTGSLENGSKLHAEKKKPWTFLVVASSGVSGMNAGGDESVEIVIRYILSDSMHVMTKRFQEMLMR